ncbi:methyl-accepting chemotaxis protein [Legionella sp. km772]|uniref:HAMP domain-containing protein n=1 Tax=Legionella sp. km772 TaxID=2498111 RepID=UPI000F8EAE45|nr:methyl-accepting chemotaxis protein [Legionella sp. km772]RUR04421.1 HAMP domain-containing protein [Legionella sp. km772]
MPHFSIQHKLLLSFLGIALLSVPLNIYLMVNFNKITNHFLTVTDAQSKSLHALSEMKNTSLHVSLITSNFNYDVEQTKSNAHTPTKLGATKDQLLAYLEEIGEWQKIYQQSLIPTEHTEFILRQLTKLRENDLLKALEVFSAKEEKNTPNEQLIKKISALEESQIRLEKFIGQTINSERERWDLIKDNADRDWLLLKRIALMINIFILILACVLGYFLSHWIANPIISLRNFTHKIDSNNLSERSPIDTKDEIGELAMSINLMLENLLQAKTQIIESSRLAGIAEVATSIIHNIGNLLNSVNTSVTLATEACNQSKVI